MFIGRRSAIVWAASTCARSTGTVPSGISGIDFPVILPEDNAETLEEAFLSRRLQTLVSPSTVVVQLPVHSASLPGLASIQAASTSGQRS